MPLRLSNSAFVAQQRAQIFIDIVIASETCTINALTLAEMPYLSLDFLERANIFDDPSFWKSKSTRSKICSFKHDVLDTLRPLKVIQPRIS